MLAGQAQATARSAKRELRDGDTIEANDPANIDHERRSVNP
jgi:hypothetical protein